MLETLEGFEVAIAKLSQSICGMLTILLVYDHISVIVNCDSKKNNEGHFYLLTVAVVCKGTLSCDTRTYGSLFPDKCSR